MNSNTHIHERGAVSGLLIATISLTLLAIAAGAVAIWAYMNYIEQKTNVDTKIEAAVVTAKKEQADIEEEKFAERDKLPNRQFTGPDDYGRLTFDYSKQWSVFVAKDATSGGIYEAYLNPGVVPPVSATTQYALRVTIEDKEYDSALATYAPLVKKGDLKSSAVSANGVDGTRFDGSFTKDIRGAAVVYKIRDKTVTVRTDADTFKPDFDTLVQTIKFNQ
ncbi:hypothetical protein D3C85_191620 [compost metagenome]|jgi:hypothetical protein